MSSFFYPKGKYFFEFELSIYQNAPKNIPLMKPYLVIEFFQIEVISKTGLKRFNCHFGSTLLTQDKRDKDGKKEGR